MPIQISGTSRPVPLRRTLLCGGAGVALVALSSARWGSVAGADAGTVDAPTAVVVVAALDIPAGSVVDSSMLTTTTLPAHVTAGLARDGASLVGRIAAVAVTKGEPIGLGMTAPRAALEPGHRLIRVTIGAADVAPDVSAGGDADLVASFAPTTSESKPTVSVVATARVVALERATDAGGASTTSDATPFSTSSPTVGAVTAVTLDCSAADALRVLWARDNARTLRLLDHPPGGPTPPAYG